MIPLHNYLLSYLFFLGKNISMKVKQSSVFWNFICIEVEKFSE